MHTDSDGCACLGIPGERHMGEQQQSCKCIQAVGGIGFLEVSVIP